MKLTVEQARKIIVDIRKANINIVAGFAVLPKDKYASSNELYQEVGKYFEMSMQELREKKIISSNIGGYGQSFSTYGFPYEIPDFDRLDCIFCYIDIINNQFRWKCIFRYITNDEIEYTTTLRIAYIPGNNRLESPQS